MIAPIIRDLILIEAISRYRKGTYFLAAKAFAVIRIRRHLWLRRSRRCYCCCWQRDHRWLQCWQPAKWLQTWAPKFAGVFTEMNHETNGVAWRSLKHRMNFKFDSIYRSKFSTINPALNLMKRVVKKPTSQMPEILFRKQISSKKPLNNLKLCLYKYLPPNMLRSC